MAKPTLDQLRKQMKDGASLEERLNAANKLMSFNDVYNAEYNLLLQLEASVSVALDRVTTNATGINQIHRMELVALRDHIQARKSMMDLEMAAVIDGEIGIDPPDQDLIGKLKELSSKVAADIKKDRAVMDIIANLTKIAMLVDGTMG